MGSYDYSLNEKFSAVKYYVEIFYLNDQESCDKLSKIMESILSGNGTELKVRKDYFNEKTGDIIVHLEWYTYEVQKLSPFEGINNVTTSPRQ